MEDKEKIGFYNELAELVVIKASLRGEHPQSEGVLKQLEQLINLFDNEKQESEGE
jgi:hypothetical protein